MAWRGVIPRERLPAGRMPLAGTNWIGPGRHVVHYPLRRGELLNFVGVVERDDWQIESWTAQGTREECLADFAGWHADVRALIEAIDVPFKWALMARAAMSRLERGPRHPAGRRLPCHAADARPGRRDGDRGRHRAGALPCEIRRGPRDRVRALRGGAPPPHHQGRRRLGRERPALPQSAARRRRAAPRTTSRPNGASPRSSSATIGSLPTTHWGWISEDGLEQASRMARRASAEVQRITARATESS